MKCLVDSKELAAGAAHVQKVADRDHPQVRLTAGEDLLVLEAMSAEGYSRVELDAEVLGPGAAAVNATMLGALTGVLPAGETRLSSDDGIWLSLKAGRAHQRLRLVAVEDMDMPSRPERMTPVPALGALIESVAPFTDPRNVSIPLRCVHITAADGTLAMEATNRLCYARRETGADGMPDMDALVAADRLKALARGADSLGVTGSALFVGGGRGVDAIPLQEGSFPSGLADRLAAADAHPLWEAGREELTAAVRLVSAAHFTTAPVTPVTLKDADGMLGLVLDDTDSAGSQVVDDADIRDAAALPMKLNAPYVLDAAAALGGRTIRVTGVDGTRPVKLTALDDDGNEDATALVYVNPIRTMY